MSNTGSKVLTINSFSISGAGAIHFRQSSNCTSVAPGGSCTVTATFIPMQTGMKTAYLNIYSDDPDESPVAVYLRGTGK